MTFMMTFYKSDLFFRFFMTRMNPFYKQIDVVAMGARLGPSLANAFLSYCEKNWLNNCPQGFKWVFYRRYDDDIFILFKSNDYLKYLQDFLNSCHINLWFSMETKKENKLSFLGIKIICEQGKFTTTIYQKPTFRGMYSNFERFSSSVYKFGMVHTLVYRCFLHLLRLDTIPNSINFSERDILKEWLPWKLYW